MIVIRFGILRVWKHMISFVDSHDTDFHIIEPCVACLLYLRLHVWVCVCWIIIFGGGVSWTRVSFACFITDFVKRACAFIMSAVAEFIVQSAMYGNWLILALEMDAWKVKADAFFWMFVWNAFHSSAVYYQSHCCVTWNIAKEKNIAQTKRELKTFICSFREF